MANCMFAYPDRSLSGTFSSGSWSTSFPLTNLTDPLLSRKARSTDATVNSTTFRIDLGQERTIRLASIIGHNLTKAATVRFEFYSDSGYTTLVYDTTALPVYPNYWPHGVLEWEDQGFWTGELSDEDAEGYHPDFYTVFNPIAARYVQVAIVDTTNPDGYVELGRCFLAPAWQWQVNLAYGAGVMYSSDTAVQRSLGGVDFFDIRNGRRSVTGTFDSMSIEEGMAMFDGQRRLDIHGELYFVFDPDDTLLLYKQRSMLCRYKQPSALEFPYFEATAVSFQLEEIL